MHMYYNRPTVQGDSVHVLCTGKYKVTVYTGDIVNAGTDANVHIVLYGDKADSGSPIILDALRGSFERNGYFLTW